MLRDEAPAVPGTAGREAQRWARKADPQADRRSGRDGDGIVDAGVLVLEPGTDACHCRSDRDDDHAANDGVLK